MSCEPLHETRRRNRVGVYRKDYTGRRSRTSGSAARTACRRGATTGLPLDERDVEPIARGQIAAEDRGAATAKGLLVLDTDLVSTTVYARHYYGACPAWIDQAARDRRGDLYLLCDIDVPWVADSVRDRPHHREHIHALFVEALNTLGAPYVLIRGSWAARLTTAVAAVSEVLDH